jgi:hypothetical protein
VNVSTKKDRIPEQAENPQDSSSQANVKENHSTAKELLRFAGTWEGDDLDECLDEVYKTRGEAIFR